MRIAILEPDIPQNTGTILRLAACLGVPVDLIAPAAFDMSERAFRRAGLDYLDHVSLTRHASLGAFLDASRSAGRRIVLLTTHGAVAHTSVAYAVSDTLLVGRESAGAPPEAHAAADVRVRIPMRAGLRSLNVAVALAIVLGESMRQTGGFGGFE